MLVAVEMAAVMALSCSIVFITSAVGHPNHHFCALNGADARASYPGCAVNAQAVVGPFVQGSSQLHIGRGHCIDAAFDHSGKEHPCHGSSRL